MANTLTEDERLTPEQHEARAMLMGLWYADRCHMYTNTRRGHALETSEPIKAIRLDADTLKPISSLTAYKRYEQWKQEHP